MEYEIVPSPALSNFMVDLCIIRTKDRQDCFMWIALLCLGCLGCCQRCKLAFITIFFSVLEPVSESDSASLTPQALLNGQEFFKFSSQSN